MKYFTTIKDQEFVVEIEQDGRITVNGETYTIDFQQLPSSGMVSLLLNNASYEGVVEERDDQWEALIRGELYTAKVEDERAYRLAKARGSGSSVTGEVAVKSPMPGIIVAVPVKVGDSVKKGEKVVILESMKMENELRSPRDGLILQVHVQKGASVEKDQALVIIGDEVED